MRRRTTATVLGAAFAAATVTALSCAETPVSQRNQPAMIRGQGRQALFSYNADFYSRLNEAYRIGAAIHFAHGKQHDVLLLTPFASHEAVDREWDAEMVRWLLDPPRIEPPQEYYGSYTARTIWRLFVAIDWTHQHHGQTYDIMADDDIPWDEKKAWTDRAVEGYLSRARDGIARSVAPLEVTMRRAAVLMKPYTTVFRNYYPRSNNFFYVAHWWHPAVYEAQMLAGNAGQEETVAAVDRLARGAVLERRPQRMLLSREMMPRYARMSPESANIFDNLHMLHGIVYDILAYDSWTLADKEREIDRVLDAMSYHPGDEDLARKFKTPHPDMDPRSYEPWMRSVDGEMNAMMLEMVDEMLPAMLPVGQEVSPDLRREVHAQTLLKMTPGIQEGEKPGSLADALKQVIPGMRMDAQAMQPGHHPLAMAEMMLGAWRKKHGGMADIGQWPMEGEPPAAPAAPAAQRASSPPERPGEGG